MFWILAGGLVLAAAGFVVWPWLRTGAARPAEDGRGGMMRALYRDRLAELDAETASGQIDPASRAAIVAELGANLLDDFPAAAADAAEAPPGAGDAPATEPTTAGAAPRLPLALRLVLLALPAAGLAVYLGTGEPAAQQLAGATEVLRLDPETERPRIEMWRDRLESRVAGHDDDAHSWYLLGIAELQLGEFEFAADAFANAHRVAGADSNIDLYWLQSRYLASGGALDAGSRAIAERVLEARPNHPLVLEMYAVDAFHRGDYRAAVEHLNRALNNPMPEAQQAALLNGLEQARSHMQALVPSIDVEVSAPPEAPRDATLFVLARPPGGGMPYAVVRRPARMLPLSVRLDDTVSMSPANRLSNAGKFEVVVRLSLSGTPAAGPGDWEWQSPVMSVADLSTTLDLKASLAPRADPDG